jgi:hypothetical protein
MDTIVYSTNTTHAKGMDSARAGIALIAKASGFGFTVGESPSAVVTPSPERVAGKCLGCGSVEVYLTRPYGTTAEYRDHGLGSNYPVGYGCELCD